ncbi:MAG: hypothetical protein Dbin4_02085 [Alphaproteobacteria bacterium]|nr:hypothetical protein [Alphaproteobacteria bacterium]
MTDNVITDDVRQFILQHIDSIAEIEGLLMFCADPQKEWDAQTIARRLYIDESQAAALLARLAELGFIAVAASGSPLQYQYQPDSESKDMIERLAVLYRQCLIPVTNLIHSKSKSRIQEFADAFKIRKD